MYRPSITYNPQPDATPEHELGTLAAIYRLAIERSKEKAGEQDAGGDDAKEIKDDCAATESLPHQP